MSRKTQSSESAGTAGMRLDKWLWCARFFKTRSLAAAAIKTGKIHVDGERPKPAKTIGSGAGLQIRRGPFEYRIRVLTLPKHRLSATEAQKTYVEDETSIAAREQLALQLKSEAALHPRTRGRPTKRERRKLLDFQRNVKE